MSRRHPRRAPRCCITLGSAQRSQATELEERGVLAASGALARRCAALTWAETVGGCAVAVAGWNWVPSGAGTAGCPTAAVLEALEVLPFDSLRSADGAALLGGSARRREKLDVAVTSGNEDNTLTSLAPPPHRQGAFM
jgi:hypothetical protein